MQNIAHNVQTPRGTTKKTKIAKIRIIIKKKSEKIKTFIHDGLTKIVLSAAQSSTILDQYS